MCAKALGWGGNASGQGRLRSGPGLPGQVRVYVEEEAGGGREAELALEEHVVAPHLSQVNSPHVFLEGRDAENPLHHGASLFPDAWPGMFFPLDLWWSWPLGVLSALLGQVPARRWQRPSCQFKPSPGPGTQGHRSSPGMKDQVRPALG